MTTILTTKGRELFQTHFDGDEIETIRARAREAVAQAHALTPEEYEACRLWVMGNSRWQFKRWQLAQQRKSSPSRWALKFWAEP